MPAKNKSRVTGAAFVLLTVFVVAIGLLIMHGHKQKQIDKGGFATSETASQTEPLGKFDDFSVNETPIVYDGNTVTERVTTEADAPATPESTTAEPSRTTADGQTEPTTAPTTTVPTTADPTATIVRTTTTTTTTTATTAPATSGSASGTYGVGTDYAYAYAGFTPQPANMNVQWNMLLVNRNYILPEDYTPDLSEAVKGSGVRMDSRVSPHYQEMYDAAKKDGITLTPLSGHRRISRQKTNFENKIATYVKQGYDRAEATRLAAKIILPPGTSEHNAGLAMDIISLDVDFEETKAFAWLQEHAQDYGFILRYPKNKESITEITYEPWHWRYVGVPAATAIKQSGKCLEEYLGAV